MSSRHLQMIAIGGSIGTGLFVASGGTIAQAGPGGALLAYAAVGLMVYLLMQSLGEMTAKIPVAGSFQTFATRFVSPSFGFAIGWNYWFNWAITVAAELVAAGIVMSFWLPDVPGWVWAGLFLAALTALNALSAKAFGEGEFWLAMIKVVTVIAFLAAGVLMIFGVLGSQTDPLANWKEGKDVFHGGWLSIISVLLPDSPSKAPSWSVLPPVKPRTRAAKYPKRSAGSSGASCSSTSVPSLSSVA